MLPFLLPKFQPSFSNDIGLLFNLLPAHICIKDCGYLLKVPIVKGGENRLKQRNKISPKTLKLKSTENVSTYYMQNEVASIIAGHKNVCYCCAGSLFKFFTL